MHPPLRVLLVEDSDNDAELMVDELQAQGIVCEVRRTEDEEGMVRELAEFRPDVVLSDYALPRFTGMAALGVAQGHDASLPVIIVTGSLNEQIAVECMKAGAADYVLKDHLVRLGSSVAAALEKRRERLAVMEADERYESLVARVPVGLFRIHPNGQFLDANPAVVKMLGCPDRESLLATPPGAVFKDSLETKAWVDRVDQEGVVQGLELELHRLDGMPMWGRMSALATRDPQGRLAWIEGSIEDITAEKRAQLEREHALQALSRSEARLRLLTEQMPAALWTTDSDLRFTSSTGTGLRAMGLRPAEVVGQSIREHFGEEGGDSPAIDAHRRALRGESVSYELAALGRVFGCHVEPFLDSEGRTVGTLGFALDVTQQKRAEETIRHQAYHDGLTGLPNRLLFADRFAQTLDHARRSGRTLAMLFLDLDRFKTINDTLGHGVGDRLLQAVAGRLSGSVRAGDTVARFGGDEFMLLLSGIENADDAARTADKVLRVVRPAFRIEDRELHVTTSIGVAIYPDDGEDLETLSKNADAALYRAKEKGRNIYQLYTPSMNATAFEQLALENDLRHALERQEFVVHYQPMVATATGMVVGAEALVRWERQGRVLAAPEFVHLAEDAGLMVPLEEWVLDAACRQVKAWQSLGPTDLRVAVNLSARHFEHPNLRRTIERVLQGADLVPDRLELELTETALMQHGHGAQAALGELKLLGVRISIDDFGTGYSSLSHLRRLPVDAIKIDRTFIRTLTSNRLDGAIVRAVVSLAHELGIEVVAEGVETRRQLEFLEDAGCDLAQGYLFSPPVPPQEFQGLVAIRLPQAEA